jgi:hypothetical protein
LDRILTNLRAEFADGLTASMANVAQIAANRERAVIQLFDKPADSRLPPDQQTLFNTPEGALSIRFGAVAAAAVERCAARVWSDGWKLSDRLYNMDRATRAQVSDTIVQGVAEQVSARELARRLESSLSQAGADNPRYKAMRIARTEINSAHREAHILSTMDPATNAKKDWIQGVGWRLSASHPHADICDVWAADDTGLGPGNYEPGDVPSDHPHGLCYTVTVLKALPNIVVATKTPRPDLVSAKEAEYYAKNQDDPAAQRWVAANNAAPPVAPPPKTASAPTGPVPLGAPVSGALTYGRRSVLTPVFDRTIKAVDGVHGDGTLPTIPIKPVDRRDANGYFRRDLNGPTEIGITKNGDGHPELTLAHEIGHFIDFAGMPPMDAFLSEETAKRYDASNPAHAAMLPVLAALEASDAVKKLRDTHASGTLDVVLADGTRYTTPVSHTTTEYYLRPREMWARSYAQYIATQSADSVLLEQLDRLVEHPLPTQWQATDFAAISKAIDGLMEYFSWRKR